MHLPRRSRSKLHMVQKKNVGKPLARKTVGFTPAGATPESLHTSERQDLVGRRAFVFLEGCSDDLLFTPLVKEGPRVVMTPHTGQMRWTTYYWSYLLTTWVRRTPRATQGHAGEHVGAG